MDVGWTSGPFERLNRFFIQNVTEPVSNGIERFRAQEAASGKHNGVAFGRDGLGYHDAHVGGVGKGYRGSEAKVCQD